MGIVLLTALGVGGATIIGSLIGFAFKNISHKFSDIVLSFAAGVMLAAAVFGLILPAVEYGEDWGLLYAVVGIFVGALCLNLIDKLVPHMHKMLGADTEEHKNANLSTVLLWKNTAESTSSSTMPVSPVTPSCSAWAMLNGIPSWLSTSRVSSTSLRLASDL